METHEAADLEQECELNEEFFQQLNMTLEKSDVDEYSWQSGRRPRWRRLAGELAKWIWWLGGVFSQIDLFGGRQEEPANRHYWRWSHHENFDRRFTKARLRWWPYVSLPLYAISSLRLLINIYYQYVYDFNFIRQQVFLALTSHSNTADVSGMLKSHLDSPFVQTILAAQERVATGALAHSRPGGSGGGLSPTLLNFSSSSLIMANTSNQHLQAGNHQHHYLHPKHGGTIRDQYRATPSLDLNQLGALLDSRVAEAYATMKRIGAPYIVMTFQVQIVYFFLLTSSFVLVILIRFYYRHYQPFDYYLVRAVLDFKHERRLFNRLVLTELNKFILSSRNFTLACVEQSRWFACTCSSPSSSSMTTARQDKSKTKAEISIEKAHARAEANRFLLDHALIKKQLQQMALGGQLLPEHRTAEWVNSLSLKFVAFAVGSLIYIIIAVLFFAFIFFALSDQVFIDAVSHMDVLTICEAGVLVTLVVPNSVFQIAIMVATCIDQIHYSTSVCRRIHVAIQVNQKRFIEICEMQHRGWWRQSSSRRRDRRSPAMSQLQNNFNPHYEQSSSSLSYGQLIDDSKRALMRRRQQSGNSSMLSSSASSVASGGTGLPFQSSPAEALLARKRRASHTPAAERNDSDLFELLKDDLSSSDTASTQNQALDYSLGIESRCTQMNVDLLRVFITYKIFVAQMRLTTRAFVTFTLACLSLIIISPLQVRIHSPYFSQFAKIMSMLFALLGVTTVDSTLILLCYMFARCTKIYLGLSSLLAHAVEVMNYAPGSTRYSLRSAASEHVDSSHEGEQYQQQIYDTHTIWLLRKELNFPERVVSQFAIVARGFRLTYSNLLKMHFWVGLLILSIFFDDSSGQEFFGRLFNDPFGVFNWP